MRFAKCVHFVSCVMLCLGFCGQTNPVWAAVDWPNPDFNDPPRPESVPTLEQKDRASSVDISPKEPAVPADARRIGYYYKYRNSLSALDFGAADSYDGGRLVNRLSLMYFFAGEWEISADLQSDNSGALAFARRWVFTHDRLRPFTRLGLGLRIDPRDEIAAVLKFENYQLRGSAGCEFLVSDPISLRLEAEVTAASRSFQLLAGLGVVWAW